MPRIIPTTALLGRLVPAFDGAYFSEREKEALWDRFSVLIRELPSLLRYWNPRHLRFHLIGQPH